jgi:broad specificity phosphatase PhoE
VIPKRNPTELDALSMTYVGRYLTHPEVVIDPEVPITEWGLSDRGRTRIERLVKSRALSGITRVVSSAERKAVETADLIAQALRLGVEIRPRMHENDRSATGYLPREEFEAVADRFFAEPMHSVRGWERAIDAQRRIVAEIEETLAVPPAGDILYVGHGGVGTLLRCWLSGLPIDRRHDQPGGGGGCMFSFSLSDRKPLGGWQVIEDLQG